MSEHEYLLEMLCCLPKELLFLKLNKFDKIPDWLKGIDNNVIKEAIELYENLEYAEQRELILKYL